MLPACQCVQNHRNSVSRTLDAESHNTAYIALYRILIEKAQVWIEKLFTWEVINQDLTLTGLTRSNPKIQKLCTTTDSMGLTGRCRRPPAAASSASSSSQTAPPTSKPFSVRRQAPDAIGGVIMFNDGLITWARGWGVQLPETVGKSADH